MSKLDGGQYFLFRGFLSSGFHHHDALLGSGHHDVQLGSFRFDVIRQGNQLAAGRSHPHRAQQMMKGNFGDGQRRARSNDGQGAGIAFRVRRKHHGDHLGLVAVAFRKQGADGTINQPAGENFLLGHPAFALDESAGKLARGIGVFTVIHREWEEARAGLRFLIRNGRDQHDRIAGSHDHSPIGLLRDFTGFEGNLSTVQVDFNGMHHLKFLLLQTGLSAPPTNELKRRLE